MTTALKDSSAEPSNFEDAVQHIGEQRQRIKELEEALKKADSLAVHLDKTVAVAADAVTRANKLTAQLEKMREANRRAAEILDRFVGDAPWIGVPVDTEAASYLGQELQRVIFEAREARAALSPKGDRDV